MKKGVLHDLYIPLFQPGSVCTASGHRQASVHIEPQWAAMQWLQLLDSGRYAASWNQAAKSFQSRIRKSQWAAGMKELRTRLGKVASRNFQGISYLENPPGIPTGKHVALQYTVSFTRGIRADEAVSMIQKNNGEWCVCGYSIAPTNIARPL